MAELRIKGQETQVVIVEDGDPQLRISSIKNTDLTFNLEKLKEGYLGETFDRLDSVFSSVAMRLDLHLVRKDLIVLADKIVQRAKRRVGGVVRIDMLTNFVFPEGDIIAIAVRDVQFGEIPLSIGGRTEYVQLSLDGEASEYELVE